MLSRDEARNLVDRIFKVSKSPEMSVNLYWQQECNTRYANNQITTAGFTTDLRLNISVTLGHKTGNTSTTDTSEEGLGRAVRHAEELAALTPEDPEYVEPLGPQNYPEIAAFDEATTGARSEQLLPALRSSIEAATREKLNASGFFDVTTLAAAIANKRGLFGYTQRTWADYSVTARTADGTGSGWADSQSPRLAEVDDALINSTAVHKALASQKPQHLDPGKYTVILEPAALDEMLSYMAWGMDARAADEGRSFLSKRGGGTLLGEKVFGENITLRSDPFDPRVPGWPWDGELPTEKTTWVEKGVVKAMRRDRYWAEKTHTKPVPFPSNIIMEGGSATLDELIASTQRGLLITHFWYIRFLQPDTVQLTGLTRDGVFYIEDGKIKHPVNNFRFNQSVVEMLKQVEGMTAPLPVNNNRLPTIKVRDFNMSSLSDAI
jgi:predicted Zn-dependent protease